MDRRNFLRNILGVAAATALPSEVWPFKKIFLPPKSPLWAGTSIIRPSLTIAEVTAVQLEAYANVIPDFVYASSPIYRRFKNKTQINPELIGSRPQSLISLKKYLEEDDDDFS